MNWRDTLQAVRQKAFPGKVALERELAGLRDEHARVMDELDGMREELSQTRVQDAEQLAGLREQLATIESERKVSQEQVRLLEASLAEAAVQRQGSEQQIRLLETKLDEARSQHEASIALTQETLLRLQSEQQGLLTLQTDLARTFHEVGRQLLESVQAQAPQPRMPAWQTTVMAGLLFLSGALLSNVVMRDTVQPVDLSPIQAGIMDLQGLMKAHFRSHDELLKILTDSLGGERLGLRDPDGVPGAAARPADSRATGRDREGVARRRLADLRVLGIDTGHGHEAALAEFRAFYLPAESGQSAASSDEVDTVLGYYADLARRDSEKYRLDSQLVAAIRLAGERTGIEFSFLMELAAAESSFNPAAQAPTSNAVGLYQFREKTWLDAIRLYGGRYGLGDLRAQIDTVADDRGVLQPVVRDPAVRATILDLRTDARLSALLAAEHARQNMRQLASRLERKPGRTDLYLTHFLGTRGAISFLQALARDPGQIAGEIFPGPAKRNRSIFHDKAHKPRTVAEIYRLFERKFNTARFSDGGLG